MRTAKRKMFNPSFIGCSRSNHRAFYLCRRTSAGLSNNGCGLCSVRTLQWETNVKPVLEFSRHVEPWDVTLSWQYLPFIHGVINEYGQSDTKYNWQIVPHCWPRFNILDFTPCFPLLQSQFWRQKPQLGFHQWHNIDNGDISDIFVNYVFQSGRDYQLRIRCICFLTCKLRSLFLKYFRITVT